MYVCLSACMYVCMYIYIHTYIYIYTYIYMYIYNLGKATPREEEYASRLSREGAKRY